MQRQGIEVPDDPTIREVALKLSLRYAKHLSLDVGVQEIVDNAKKFENFLRSGG